MTTVFRYTPLHRVSAARRDRFASAAAILANTTGDTLFLSHTTRNTPGRFEATINDLHAGSANVLLRRHANHKIRGRHRDRYWDRFDINNT